MTTVTAPNLMILSKKCELFYNGQNVFVPFGSFPTKQLADVLSRFESVDIQVQYRAYGDEEQRAADSKTYTRRLRTLPPNYVFTGFTLNNVGQMTGRLKRCQ